MASPEELGSAGRRSHGPGGAVMAACAAIIDAPGWTWRLQGSITDEIRTALGGLEERSLPALARRMGRLPARIAAEVAVDPPSGTSGGRAR
jgi:hypothetical protein